MSINGASTIVGYVSYVIWGGGRLNTVINKVMAAFIAKGEGKTLPTPS